MSGCIGFNQHWLIFLQPYFQKHRAFAFSYTLVVSDCFNYIRELFFPSFYWILSNAMQFEPWQNHFFHPILVDGAFIYQRFECLCCKFLPSSILFILKYFNLRSSPMSMMYLGVQKVTPVTTQWLKLSVESPREKLVKWKLKSRRMKRISIRCMRMLDRKSVV